MFLVWSWEGETESVPAAEEPRGFPSLKACRTLIQHPPSTIAQYPLALGDPEVLPEFGQTNRIGPKSGKTLRFGITGTTSIKKKAVDVARTQASSTCFPSLRTSSGLLESFALPADPALFICPTGEPPPHPPWTPQPSTSREPPAPRHTWVRQDRDVQGWWITFHGAPAPTPPNTTTSSLLPLEHSFSVGHTGIWLPPI